MSGNGALASLLGSARIAVRVRAVLLGVKHSHMNALWEWRGKPNVGEEARKTKGNGLISAGVRGGVLCALRQRAKSERM